MSNKKCSGQCLSRRRAIDAGARVGLAVAAGGLAVACGTQSSNKGGGDSGGNVATTGGVATLDFAAYPNLQNTGGSYRINVNGNPVSVTRLSATVVVAVQALCSHQGATLNDYSGGGFSCPRHGATFSADGTATGGPAGGNLSTYPATLGTTGVTVQIG